MNKYVVGLLLAIPVLNVLFYFLAAGKEGKELSGADIAVAIVGLLFFVLLTIFAMKRAHRKPQMPDSRPRDHR